jgi:membrane protein YdbS with pleckstrin-like domain
MGTNRDEKVVSRMNFIFWSSMALQFVAAVAIFIGLVARGYKHPWGIWFTICGWIAFWSGFVIHSWIRRWFYKRLDE